MVESTKSPIEDEIAGVSDGESDGESDGDTVVAAAPVEVQSPAFEQLDAADSTTGTSIDRFYDVTVKVSATLGSVSMSLGELVRLGEGAVVKLDRPVTAPVELVAQGVRVARGEVVVVDDCFAVRITEIESRKPSN